jgi:glucose-1-phosphate cytidylyltransferase
MKLYSIHGHRDFILCLGYLGEKIKEYFQNPINVEKDWNITFVNTGLESNKTERLSKVRDLIKGENFLVAYGDDLSDVNINQVIKFHLKNNRIVTLTAINLRSKFGILQINSQNEVVGFREKPKLNHWINGGFFVFNKKIFDYFKKGWDLEKEVFSELAKIGQIGAYKHEGFWMCMNTFKDVLELNELWDEGKLQTILYSKHENS